MNTTTAAVKIVPWRLDVINRASVIEDFPVNKQGKVNSTGLQHTKPKRAMESIETKDLWDDFFYEIKSWNHPVYITYEL